MTIALRGTGNGSTGSGGAATVSATVSTGPSANDVILLWVSASVASCTWTTPTGFTAIVPFGASNDCGQLFYKVAAGTEGTSYSATCSASTRQSLEVRIYSGVNTSTPFDPTPSVSGAVNGTASTTLTVAGITTTVANDWLVWFGNSKGSANGAAPATITIPSGFGDSTTQASTASTTSGNIGSISCDEVWATAGATGSQNGTLSASDISAGLLIGLQPGSLTYTVSVSASPVSAAIFARRVGWGRSPAVTSTTMAAKAAQRGLTALAISSTAVVRSVAHSVLSAGAMSASTLTKTATRSVAAISNSSAVMSKQVSRILATPPVTSAVSVVKATGRVLAATSASGANTGKLVTRTVAAGVVSAVTEIATHIKMLTLSTVGVSAAALTKLAARTLSGAATSSTTAGRAQTLRRLLAATVTSGVSTVRSAARTLTVAVSATPTSVAKSVAKWLTGGVSSTTSATPGHVFERLLAATATAATSITRQTGKVLTAAAVSRVTLAWQQIKTVIGPVIVSARTRRLSAAAVHRILHVSTATRFLTITRGPSVSDTATTPATVTQASNEDISWGIDVTALLSGSQTVAATTATLYDLSAHGAPITLTDTPSASGGVVVQRIRPGVLNANHNYRLVVTITPSGTTNIIDSVLCISCPF